jgi:8-oxo-dGTP diphosphatase
MTDYPRPALTADVVLLRYRDGWLEVLLIERSHAPFEGCWALPGGFVDAGEAPAEGAIRELAEETGVTDVALREVGVFGEPGRDPRGWVVSAAFLGLAPTTCVATAGDDARAATWHRMSAMPTLAFDHGRIIDTAMDTLRQLTQVETTPMLLLPTPFRTAQARHLYSQILGRPLRPSTFKAWLRRRAAVVRVGPARFQRAESLRADWLR